MRDSYERYREYQGNRCEYEMEQFTAPIVGILWGQSKEKCCK